MGMMKRKGASVRGRASCTGEVVAAADDGMNVKVEVSRRKGEPRRRRPYADEVAADGEGGATLSDVRHRKVEIRVGGQDGLGWVEGCFDLSHLNLQTLITSIKCKLMQITFHNS
jgi:hypothetical protein